MRTEPFGRLELPKEELPLGRTPLFIVAPDRPPGCVAEGGRLDWSCDMRLALIFCGMFCEGLVAMALLFAALLNVEVFIVWTGI